jgi:ferritin
MSDDNDDLRERQESWEVQAKTLKQAYEQSPRITKTMDSLIAEAMEKGDEETLEFYRNAGVLPREQN